MGIRGISHAQRNCMIFCLGTGVQRHSAEVIGDGGGGTAADFPRQLRLIG